MPKLQGACALVPKWRFVDADQVCTKITKGTTPPASEIVPETQVPFVRVNNLTQGGSIGLTSSLIYVSRSAHEGPLARSIAKPGDTLMNIVGPPLGKIALLTSDYPEYNLNQAIIIFRPDPSKVDPTFLYYYISSYPSQQWLASRSKKTSGQQNLTIELCKLLPVPELPLFEQRKIAEILRTWDEAIETYERVRLKKIEQATWFRTDLFTGKVRLKGYSDPWRKVTLSAVLNEHGLHSSGTEEVFSVSVHKGLINQIEHLGRSFAAKETAHYNRVLPGDIVYTKSPTGDFPLGIIKQSKLTQDVIVSPLYGVFTPTTRDLGVILDAYFRSPVTVRNYLAPLVQKGAKNTIAITNSRFLEGELLLPLDPKEQRAIAEIVEDADAERYAIERQKAAYQQQKRGLMQKLLTGEWRVKVEKEAAA